MGQMRGMRLGENIMRIKACTTAFMLLIATFGPDGFIETASAVPDDSQRLRGLGGRTFAVEVTNLTDGSIFQNCYVFDEDGTWSEPLFPVPGTWMQNSIGAKTTYSASALLDIGGGLGVLLEQHGTVTPAGGTGVLQIEAFSSASVIVIADSSLIAALGDFYSVGQQDNDCSL